jgi:[1-hydroxy-2-(trimethylamino)ethyl]phosphonate dioxygenase
MTVTVGDEVLSIYQRCGAAAYFGEAVSMSEHGLQAAHFARADGASDALVIAALLHDIGHLIQSVPDDVADWHSDAHHELAGSRWLSRRFGPGVCEPVRLHVPAKRFLCATEPAYFQRLSAASVLTLKLQGGPMSSAEIAGFQAEPYHREAIAVRRWDDRGKIAGLATPDFVQYRALIERVAAASGSAG